METCRAVKKDMYVKFSCEILTCSISRSRAESSRFKSIRAGFSISVEQAKHNSYLKEISNRKKNKTTNWNPVSLRFDILTESSWVAPHTRDDRRQLVTHFS